MSKSFPPIKKEHGFQNVLWNVTHFDIHRKYLQHLQNILIGFLAGQRISLIQNKVVLLKLEISNLKNEVNVKSFF